MSSIRMLGLALASGAAVASSRGAEPSLHVCVGADRVLRHLATEQCPSGTTSYDLALEGKIEDPPKDEDKALQQQLDELKRKLNSMTSLVSDLQRALADAGRARAGGKVMAPFEIVNEAGKSMLRVYNNPDGGATLTLMASSGEPVLWASALNGGGVFKTRGSASFPEVVMGTSGQAGGFAIRDGENTTRVGLMLTNGKPALSLSNDNHVGIVSLMQGASGGGQLELGDAGGNGQVRAGVAAGGCGRVETYPERPAKMMGGLSSFILGGSCK